MRAKYFFPALLVSIGLIVGGFFIGRGFIIGKSIDRYVTVKGLAEKEVDANLAIWPIIFTEPSNNLSQLEAALQIKSQAIIEFLKASGFWDDEIGIGVPSITDFQATDYYSGEKKQYRYLGKGKLTVNTNQVDLLRKTMSRTTELIGEGIVVAAEAYDNRVQFLYTKLNEVKPAMIEEATINARMAAEKFASDSDSKLGKIRRADQGLFTISDRDFNSPHKKKIRVVSTIQYLLEE